ncbi:MAG: hypothetical protein ACLQVY_26885 [Limisphaerales bacterium]
MNADLAGSALVISWVTPAPDFVLQQVNHLGGDASDWADVTNASVLSGRSNLVAMPLRGAAGAFLRARQR